MYNIGIPEGLVNLVAVGLSFLMEMVGYLVEEGGFGWVNAADGQIVVSGGEIPDLTAKGADIVGALMTIIHNGIVAVAQISTLLPANVN
jgi:hypothetical protein